MSTNKTLINSLFIANYISSVLMFIFTGSIRLYYAQTWSDTGFYRFDDCIAIFYISILLTIIFISMTIHYYRKLKKFDDNKTQEACGPFSPSTILN